MSHNGKYNKSVQYIYNYIFWARSLNKLKSGGLHCRANLYTGFYWDLKNMSTIRSANQVSTGNFVY